MNDAIYIFRPDAELSGLPGAVPDKPIIFGEELVHGHGIFGLLRFGLLDGVHHPSSFIPIALPAIPTVNAHHLAEEFAPGAVLRLRQSFHLFGYGGWYGEPDGLGCSAHVDGRVRWIILSSTYYEPGFCVNRVGVRFINGAARTFGAKIFFREQTKTKPRVNNNIVIS
jgi:hypothetical protein